MVTVPLRRLMDSITPSALEGVISHFSCARNRDIETFLKSKAIDNETRHVSRTYLIFDDENDILSTPVILGYYTISLKVFEFPKGCSNTTKKYINGFPRDSQSAQAYLIAQIARNDHVSSQKIGGNTILDAALSQVFKAQDIVGGRAVLVECVPEMVNYYQDYGFSVFAEKESGNEAASDTPLVPLFALLKRFESTKK